MAEPIRFLLNGAPVALADIDPQLTLLEWLREERGLTGTKEGCAEGDCGACTVVLAERRGNGLTWRPVNACIRLLPSLHGKAVFTVESLQEREGCLHPVQQALVECHGSQCGFCTPGFSMSLFALYKSTAQPPERDAACDALAGNLCRCTGYRPIIAAAQRMHALPAPGGWRAPASGGTSDGERGVVAALAALDGGTPLDYAANGRRWLAPRTLPGLVALRAAHPDARIVAGATDLALLVTKQHRDLPDLLYVGDVQELRAIESGPDGLRIGAAAALTDAFDALDADFPELREVWQRFASPPLRASGTLGGNVANGSPIGDSMPVLLALDAAVELVGARGARRMPLDRFYLGYRRTAAAADEIVSAIVVPPRPANLLLRAYKVSKRYDQDISAAFAAFALVRDGGTIAAARIGCGGVAAVPARAPRTEALLAGQTWSESLAARAADALADEFTPIDDMRASAAYRRTVLGNLLRRLWHDTRAGAPVVRVEAVTP